MIDSVMVHLIIPGYKFESDMELPANMEIGELKTELLRVLKEILSGGDSNFSLVKKIVRIRANGNFINDEDTLYGFGVWDGGTVEIIV